MIMSTPMSQESPKPLLALQTTTSSPITDQEESHHHHHHGGNNNNNNNGNVNNILQLSPAALQIRPPPPPFSPFKKSVKYMECLKNHAAAIGGTATDGCGEFMAGGEEGTLEALKCSACNCHRNFHRKIQLHPEPPPSAAATMVDPHDQFLMMKKKRSGNNGAGGGHDDDEQQRHQMGNIPVGAGAWEMGKKRYRTKFSQEQKEKMQVFAEKAGWKIQKLDDADVRSFCQEIGIKRKVLKVWMHNNKYHLAKKTTTINDTTTTAATST